MNDRERYVDESQFIRVRLASRGGRYLLQNIIRLQPIESRRKIKAQAIVFQDRKLQHVRVLFLITYATDMSDLHFNIPTSSI